MATQLFANNATGALAAGITNSATSLNLVTGQGALFPTPSGGDWFLLTLTQATGPESFWEIVKCTARSGDTLTVVRAQEGTTALAWATAKAELRITAGTLVPAVAGGANGLLLGVDKTKLDATSGTNTGDETLASIKSKLGISTLSGSNTGDQTLPTTLPASDVYGWAKAATKPTYTYSEVGAQAAGTYASGTGSASGTNTGDETLASIKSKLGISTLSGSNTGDQTLPTTLPASDVYAWAKAATKPAYTAAEVGAPSGSGTHSGSSSGTNTGDQTNISGNAATASSAATVNAASAQQNGDGWWRSSGATGWYSTTYAVGIYATEAGNVRTYNGANFISGGTVSGSNLSGTHTGNSSGTNTGDQTLPTTLPASDVYSWAKAASKPAYTATEVAMVVVVVSGTTQTAVAAAHYILTNGAATTLTLPSSPAAGDAVWVTGANGLLTNVIARNGQTIMGSATDLTMNIADTTVQLRFVNSSWRLL